MINSIGVDKFGTMRKLFFILIPFILWACSPVSIKTVDATDLDLASYKTYNYLKFRYSHYDSIPYNEKNYTFFIEQIDKNMAAKGLSLAEDPNLIINIGLVVSQKEQTRETDVRTDMNYAGNRRYQWEVEEQVVGVYDVGDVTIDFVDAEKNKLVWQASIEGMLTKKEEKMQTRITDGVNKIFKNFPSK